MKTLTLILIALTLSQAQAATISCTNSDTELEETLKIEGLLENKGDLEFRASTSSLVTLVSKRNHLDHCDGLKMNPDKDLLPMGSKWSIEKFSSGTVKILVARDKDGVIKVSAADPTVKINFRDCTYEQDADDSEIIAAKEQEIKDFENLPENIEARKQSTENLNKALLEQEERRKKEPVLIFSAR